MNVKEDKHCAAQSSCDDEYLHTFNPLEYYSLVKIGEFYYCPVIIFLGWRITSGLYFDLINDNGSGHSFGLAFQDYIEEISHKVLSNKTIVLAEQKYRIGKNKKDSVDVILSQSDSALFVDAKAKRLQSIVQKSSCQASKAGG